MSNWPDVAVIMPVLNEERYLADAVRAILNQDYSGYLRVILAVGPSSDLTEKIARQLSLENPNVVFISSPTGRTPDSLNLAIKESHEDIIVRVDAHAELSDRYIEKAVETLRRTGADNVGGIMGAVGKTSFEKAVAAAMTSSLGVGSSAFHTGGKEGPAESVYLGVFKRSALERVGGYDPKFTRAQDWEMNHRIRSTGGIVWFNPELFVTYRPRPNIKKLAKQYFQYGNWRREVMRQHPETKYRKSTLRYFAPPVTLISFTIGLILGLVGFLKNNWLSIFLLAPIVYLLFIFSSAIYLRSKARPGAIYLPLVLLVMQFSWASGFIFGKALLNKQN